MHTLKRYQMKFLIIRRLVFLKVGVHPLIESWQQWRTRKSALKMFSLEGYERSLILIQGHLPVLSWHTYRNKCIWNAAHSDPLQQTRLGHTHAGLWGEFFSNVCTDVPNVMTKCVQQSVNSVFWLLSLTERNMTSTKLIKLSRSYVIVCPCVAHPFVRSLQKQRDQPNSIIVFIQLIQHNAGGLSMEHNNE